MATPDAAAASTGPTRSSSPGTTSSPTQHSEPFFSLDSGPNGSSCPGMVRPFEPRLVAGTSNPVAGDLLELHPEARPRRRRPVPRRPQLQDAARPHRVPARHQLLPGGGDRRGRRAASGVSRAGEPELPGQLEQIGTTQRRRRARAATPSTRSGRCTSPGPFKGAPLSLVAITPALAGPYDYGTVVVRVALHVDPPTAQVTAVSDTVPSIIGGVPIRMRSIQVNIDKPNFTINPTNCAPFSVDSQGIGDQGTVTDFSSYFHAVNCCTPRLQAEDDHPPARRQQGHEAQPRTRRLQFDLYDPVRATPTSSRSR